ncbi:MAG: helix-turn-helix transcriptional regulator [Muribaculaceae bacterium]|nr:helix-turn-helix transcriptional regulator [Muribaculaceae bacterium]
MVRNNHFTHSRKKLDELLKFHSDSNGETTLQDILNYARFKAEIENVIVVISDMADGKSHITAGGFARCLGIEDYCQENSIWENRILSLMVPEEQEEKYIAELRFFHFIRHLPKKKKREYSLVSRLRFRFTDGMLHDVLHRMHYIYDDLDMVRFAICVYGPATFEMKGKSYVVNTVTGEAEALTSSDNNNILSRRERQVLSLIDAGMNSTEIADRLNISVHTVSRHRQEIIGRLQVKNTHEACRIAKSLELIQ